MKIYDSLKQSMLSVIVNSGKKNNQLFEETTYSFMEKNKSLLFKILSDNKNTVYGKKYDFRNIKSIDDYKKNVPVTTYYDYSAYINKMIYGNEKNQITSYPISFYARTSGTTGQSKVIPYTYNALKIYNKYGGNNNILARLYDGKDKSKLNNKFLILATSNLATLPNGKKYGGLSEKMLVQKKNLANFISVVPSQILFPEGETDSLAFQARFALAEKNISYCYNTFCTQFLQLIQYIERNYEMLVDDIRYGTINESLLIPEKAKKQLLKKIKPDPERADELSEIFSQGFKGVIPKIWKSFSGFAGISSGGFKIYYDRLKYYLSDTINADMYGYTYYFGRNVFFVY